MTDKTSEQTGEQEIGEEILESDAIAGDDMLNIAIQYAPRDIDAPRSGPVQVGWLLSDRKGAVIYDPPERVRSPEMSKRHAKSASRCPAVLNLESRYFAVKCPYDIHLRFGRSQDGKPRIASVNGEASAIRPSKLNEYVHLVREVEWRYPARPTIQLKLPYVFIADEPVWMTQTSAFLHYRRQQLPGTIFGGRFPIHVWPRPLMWAFEWHDTTQDLILKRGEPLFYCMFETNAPERPIQMVEVEKTPDLADYIELISGAVNYANQTFSLFKSAEAQRPSRLMKPKVRN